MQLLLTSHKHFLRETLRLRKCHMTADLRMKFQISDLKYDNICPLLCCYAVKVI